MHHSVRLRGGEHRFLVVAAGEQADEQVAVLLELDLRRLLVDHEKAIPERILAEGRVVEHRVQVLLQKPALLLVLFVVEQVGRERIVIEQQLLRVQVDVVQFRFVWQRWNDQAIARVRCTVRWEEEVRRGRKGRFRGGR